LLNQGRLERIEIDGERVVRDQETELFAQHQHLGRGWDETVYVPSQEPKTPSSLTRTGGLNIESLVPLQRFVPNGEIIVPVEAALDLAPQAKKRRPSYKQIRVPRRDL
jgi:hypothetical protein